LIAQHAVVTGGASGIGAAVVERFIDRGLKVSVFDPAEPSSAHQGADYYTVDVTDQPAVEQSIAEATERRSRPDVLVTSHGIRGSYVPALELDPEHVRRVFDVHVLGTLLVASAFARPLLEAQRQGSIVTVSSTTAYGGWPQQADYGTAKAAVRQLTYNLAIEWAPFVRVTSVAPGHTSTPMVRDMVANGFDLAATEKRTPLGRLSAPAEIAGTIEHLALDATSTTGICIPVDGGWTAVGK